MKLPSVCNWRHRRKLLRCGICGLVIVLLVVVMKYNPNGYNGFLSTSIPNAPKAGYADMSTLEKLISIDIAKQVAGLGDNGDAVTLLGSAKRIGDDKLSKIAINEEVSEHISYNRSIPDIRHSACKSVEYNYSVLPTASIVIIFHNEPYSVLMRTIHSVIKTTDPRVVKEILLVDDFSTNGDLHLKLDYYVATRFTRNLVKIIRLRKRLGLIRARLAGARAAQEQVLIFLDAHCECLTGWLEPLLEQILKAHTSVLVPIIDVIDANNFKYSANGYHRFQVGGFTWDGHFDWIDVPKRELNRQRRECPGEPNICPTYSPTMAGGLFAISRDFFWEIGSYDEQMDGWGGENLEMSFRIWQCGGTIETIPCSRVGHIFREFHPYEFPNNRDTHAINTIRMALVWMDEFIDILYINRPDMKNNIEIGDVTHRLILRQKLKCKSFKWYLANVFPEKFIPTRDVISYGRFVANIGNLCFDDLQQNSGEPYNLGLYTCQKSYLAKSQFFSLTRSNTLRNEHSCATVQRSKSLPYFLVMIPCKNNNKFNDKWEYLDGQLKHVKTNLCIERKGLKSNDFLLMDNCQNKSESQKWRIEH